MKLFAIALLAACAAADVMTGVVNDPTNKDAKVMDFTYTSTHRVVGKGDDQTLSFNLVSSVQMADGY